MAGGISRRVFLVGSCAGVSSAWLAANWPEITAAQRHAHKAAQSGGAHAFQFLEPGQAAELEAVAAQIIPTDDMPGAREARVIFFIDRALATFAAADRAVVLKGLKGLQSKVKKMFGTSKRFFELSSRQQVEALEAIEKTQFFETVRTLTIIGMFANAEYGGNREQSGWKLMGFEDDFYFEPPFGFYDRELEQESN